MNRVLHGLDLWRLGVALQMVVLTVRAAGEGRGGQALALVALVIIALLTAVMALSRPRLPRWLMVWMGLCAAFCAWAALTSLWSLSLRTTLVDAVTSAVMLSFIALTAATRWQDRAKLLGDLAFVFALVLAVQVTAILAGMVGVDTVYDPDYGRFRGWFSNANYAGMMSAFGLSIVPAVWPVDKSSEGDTRIGARAGVPWLVLGGCAVLVAALTLSQSRGALLALAVAVAVLVFPRIGWRRAVAVVVLAGVVASTAVVINALTNEPPGVASSEREGPNFDPITRDEETDVTSGRVGIYKELLVAVKDNPLGGTGYRTTELNKTLDGSAGHNIYLSTFAEVGLVGGLLFLGVLAVPVVRALSEYRFRLGAPEATGALMVVLGEVFESSILGWGSPTTLFAWLLLLGGACAVGSTALHPTEAEAR